MTVFTLVSVRKHLASYGKGARARIAEIIASMFASRDQIFVFMRMALMRTRRHAAPVLALLLLASLAEGASVLLLVPLLSAADGLGAPAQPNGAGALAGLSLDFRTALFIFVALALGQALLSRWKDIRVRIMMNEFVSGLRLELFTKVAGAKWLFVSKLRGSDLTLLLGPDVDKVGAGVFNVFMLIQSIVVLACYMAISLLISPLMTWFAALIGLAARAVLAPIRARAVSYGMTLTANQQEQFRTVGDFTSGLKVAKGLNAEPQFVLKLASTLARMREDMLRFVRIASGASALVQVVSAAGLAIFLYVAIDRFALPLAELVVLIFVFMRVSPRFLALQSHLQEISVQTPVWSRLNTLLGDSEAAAEPISSEARPEIVLKQGIELRDVSLDYGEGAGVALTNVSCTIPAQRITALIGHSGSGKSTIADIVLGLLDPTGDVLLDGRALEGSRKRAWRACVGYVPQEVFLLNDTIGANLRLAAPQASDADLWAALSEANARALVERLPRKLETSVGERGARFSGGERQRLALARALLRKPELLVLDEATSALDWASQNLIAKSIQALKGRMTVITIAHRASMIASADHVIALEHGRVVESGTLADLLRLEDGHLVRLMAGERGVEAAEESS